MMASFTDEELELLLAAQPLRRPSPQLDRRVQAELLRPRLALEDWGEGKGRPAQYSSPQRMRSAESATEDASALTLPLFREERGLSHWRLALALAACLMLAVGLWLYAESHQRTAAPAPLPLVNAPAAAVPSPLADFNPVRIEEVWSRVAPDGVVTFDAGSPVRRYRQRTLQHVQLIDEDRNIRIEYTVPRDDLLVTPVRFD
jgi:hypothetical protein